MSDVETMTPAEPGMGDVLSRLKEKLSGQAAPATAPKPERQQVTEPAEEESSEAVEYEDDDDSTAPEAAAAEHDDDQDDDQPDEAKDEELEINGKKIKAPKHIAAEVKALAKNLQADYTRKTQEAAELRKATESEAAEARRLRQEYMQGMQLIQHALRITAPQPPPEALLDDDPIEYQRLSLKHQKAMEQFHATIAETQRVAAHQAAEEQREAAKALKEAAAKLPELIPAWRDAKRAEVEKKQVAEYLQKAGYAPQEIQSASDPRAVMISRKAMLYDRMMAKKATVTPAAPVTEKPGPSRTPSHDSAAKRSREKLRKTGKMDDGFAAFKAKLSRINRSS